MSEPVARLAYEEARRMLDLQRETVDGLRTRAGTLLAAAALVTTFLGEQALEGGGSISCGEWVAISLFLLCAFSALVVLLPWSFAWGQRTETLVQQYVDDPKVEPETMLRDLSLHHEASQDGNRRTVTALQWAIRVSSFFLAAEVVAWLIEIG